MISSYKTEQESFWAGTFGTDYIERNKDLTGISSNLALFGNILRRTKKVESIIEYGANIGLNLIALHQLLRTAELSAVEINKAAVEELKKNSNIKVYHDSLLNFIPNYQRDFVLVKGVLIHINPDFLPQVYDLLFKSTKRYICIVEYYNPSPVEVVYRGHEGKLFKRDFAGEVLDRFSELTLVDYGFCYHRDQNFLYDDVTWFLLEKQGA